MFKDILQISLTILAIFVGFKIGEKLATKKPV